MHHGVKTLQFGTALVEGSCHAAHQCGCGVNLFLSGVEVGQIDLYRGITIRMYPNNIGTVQCDLSGGFQIDRRCQHTAVLMIGMVAADFRAAGSRETIVFCHSNFTFK